MSRHPIPKGKKLPRNEEAQLPALLPTDRRPDEAVWEESGFSFDVDRHFLRLLPKFVADRVRAAPTTWWDKSEAEIVRETWPEHNSPDDVCARLRIALWDEYDRCFRFKLGALDFERCLRGICTIGYFRSRILSDFGKLAFLCTAPPVYENQVRLLHQKGLSELQKILALPNEYPDGTADSKIADVKRRIYESLDMRLKGAVIQRIDQRNINVNIDGDPSMAGDAPKPDEMLAMDEIEAEIRKLEETSARLSIPGGGAALGVIDVEASETGDCVGGSGVPTDTK